MPDATPALYVDSGGGLQPVAPGDTAGVEQLGWVPASEKQAADFKLQQEHGSAGAQLGTFAEHAAGVATFGLSDLIGDPEQARARSAANPVSAIAGDVAGIPLGMAVLPGGGAPGLIAKAGEAAAEAVAPRAAAAVLKGTPGLAAKALRGAVGLGAEGALYGGQQVVHEAALGDPALTAESALAMVAGSALAGGVLGAGGGVLGHLISGSMGGESFTARVKQMLADTEAHSNLNATNAMPAEIKALIRNKGPENAAAIGREARDLGIIRNPLTDSTEAIAERAQEVVKRAGQQIDEIAAKAAQAGAPVTDFGAIRAQVETPIVDALRKQGSTFALADQFSARMDQFAQAYAGRALDSTGLLALKRDLGEFIYTNKSTFDVWGREVNKPLSRAMGHVTQLLEEGIGTTLGKDGVAALKAANREAEVGLTFKALTDSGLSRTAANNPVHVSAMFGATAGAAAGGPLGAAVAGLGAEAVRRRGASATGYAARALRGLIDPTAEVGAATVGAIAAARQAGQTGATLGATASPQAAAALGALQKTNATMQGRIGRAALALVKGGAAEAPSRSTPADTMALYLKRTAAVQQAAVPQRMVADLDEHTKGLHDHAPQTAQQYAAAHARLVGHLASKIAPTQDRGILAPAQTATKAQMRDFNARYDAATDPVAVIHAAAAGHASPAQLDTLAQVYPALHQAAKMAVLQHIATLGPSNVPRGQHAILSALTGQRLNASVSGPQIMRTQMALATAPQAQPHAGKPLGAAKALTMGTRALTSSQASASRR